MKMTGDGVAGDGKLLRQIGARAIIMKANTYLAIVIAAVVVVGCATEPGYNASASNRIDAARVTALAGRPFFLMTTLERVDGVPIKHSQHGTFASVLVDPGERKLTVMSSFPSSPFKGKRADAELTATLMPGHSYKLRAEKTNGLVAIWVEEAKAKKLVGVRQTVPAVEHQRSGSSDINSSDFCLDFCSALINCLLTGH